MRAPRHFYEVPLDRLIKQEIAGDFLEGWSKALCCWTQLGARRARGLGQKLKEARANLLFLWWPEREEAEPDRVKLGGGHREPELASPRW